MALRQFWCVAAIFGVSVAAQAQTYGVGAGSTPAVQTAFVAAYQRGSFSALTGPAIENVTSWGSGGLIQRFTALGNASNLYALVKPDSTSALDVVQVTPALYAYYSTVTAAIAGFPTADTSSCPALKSAAATATAGNTCVWQPFSNTYALFAYTAALGTFGQTFATRNTFYTNWTSLGGITGIGPAESPEKQIYSIYSTGALEQIFDQGVIYNMDFGPSNDKVFTVLAPIYAVYLANGAENGSLGLPTGPVQLNSDGTKQQNFDRGAISYNATTLVATLQPAVATVSVSLGSAAQMYVGEALGATAATFAAGGSAVIGRTVTWNSSNPAVVQIVGTGTNVSLHALSSGIAAVTATSEHQTSVALNVTVAACCQVGQGAPTNTLEQYFQNAVSRNNLTVQLPAAAGVVRAGNGYTQQLVSATGGLPYLVTVADNANSGYVVSGSALTQYLQLGGPTGPLGYPLSDPTAGGRQMFQGGALAGYPAQAVTGAILAKWQLLGYETGTAGSPVSAASSFVTAHATNGLMQSFQNGQILAATTGALAGQGFYVTGLILARYSAGGGPTGALGAPITDERPLNGQQRQDFEGGYVYYTPGDSLAVEFDTPRTPAVSVNPGSARAGSSVHVIVTGFQNNATVRVSQTGQADFLVTAANGTYAWDEFIPASTAAQTVTVTAVDSGNSATTAHATYSVYTTAAASMTLSVLSGDQQSGPPGALLPLPLTVILKDQNGNGIAGQTVAFASSPGALPAPASATTDGNGQAAFALRMPASIGITLATAQVGHAIATFNERSQAISLANFPALSQNVSGTLGNGSDTIQSKGALLTAAASILLYHQSRNELPQPDGLASPVTLNQFLASYCTNDLQGNSICDGFVTLGTSPEQTVNLWRLGAFVGNNLTVQIEPATQDEIRDLLSLGAPSLLALQLGGLGSHFVVATGVASDGSILIADPNPAFAQTTLNGYLGGFGGVGQYVQATLAGVVRLLPQAPAKPGFLAAANASAAISSGAGSCTALSFPGLAAASGIIPSVPPAPSSFAACDGSAGIYELDVSSTTPYNATFTDLAPNGARTFLSAPLSAGYPLSSGYTIEPAAPTGWQITPLVSAVTSILNAASFTSGIAPGGLISIFGAGLANATVQVNGQSATVLAATPFQVNAQIPAAAATGPATVQVNSPNGVVQQSVAVSAAAPAIFSIGSGQAAITNVDNSLNTPTNPAKRGSYLVVYATGFGALGSTGAANAQVSAVIGGVAVAAAYGGASSTAGLNQANLLIPATLPPGLSVPLYLVQNGVVSNTVTVAIE